jgi:hypothetical protein
LGDIVKRIEVVRHIAADPASVALLLADPTGDGEADETRLRVADADAIDVSAPRRSGVGFVAELTVRLRGEESIRGEIRVEPATDPGCDARIVLTVPSGTNAGAVQRQAGKFLSDLGDRARSRSYAA